MQNLLQKFMQSSIVFKKPDILSENLKNLASSNYLTVQYFLLKLRTHVSHLLISTKACDGFFSFYLDLKLFAKIKKN